MDILNELTEKENRILDGMEDVISEKVGWCKKNVQNMTDKDWIQLPTDGHYDGPNPEHQVREERRRLRGLTFCPL